VPLDRLGAFHRRFPPGAARVQGESASVGVLNEHGALGWEAVGMTTLADGSVAVLLRRSGTSDAH
jgi:hypothetical protein